MWWWKCLMNTRDEVELSKWVFPSRFYQGEFLSCRTIILSDIERALVMDLFIYEQLIIHDTKWATSFPTNLRIGYWICSITMASSSLGYYGGLLFSSSVTISSKKHFSSCWHVVLYMCKMAIGSVYKKPTILVFESFPTSLKDVRFVAESHVMLVRLATMFAISCLRILWAFLYVLCLRHQIHTVIESYKTPYDNLSHLK